MTPPKIKKPSRRGTKACFRGTTQLGLLISLKPAWHR